LTRTRRRTNKTPALKRTPRQGGTRRLVLGWISSYRRKPREWKPRERNPLEWKPRERKLLERKLLERKLRVLNPRERNPRDLPRLLTFKTNPSPVPTAARWPAIRESAEAEPDIATRPSANAPMTIPVDFKSIRDLLKQRRSTSIGLLLMLVLTVWIAHQWLWQHSVPAVMTVLRDVCRQLSGRIEFTTFTRLLWWREKEKGAASADP